MRATFGTTALGARLLFVLGIVSFLTQTVIAISDPIPSGSQLVAYIHPDKILKDPLLSTSNPRNLRKIAEELEHAGLSVDDLYHSILFVTSSQSDWLNMSSSSSAEVQYDWGCLMPDFQKTDILISYLGQSPCREETYSSSGLTWWTTEYLYFVDKTSGLTVAVIDDYGVALTSSETVMKNVLDVVTGNKPGMPYDDFCLTIANEYKGNPNILAAFCLTPPLEALDIAKAVDVLGQAAFESMGASGMGTLMEASGQVERISALIASNGKEYRIEIQLGMDSEKSASFISGIFQMGTGLMSMVPKKGPEADLLKSLRVSRQGSSVWIGLKITQKQLMAMMHEK